MRYVDVTGACLLPTHTGIPRTTRGVYRLLQERRPEETKPIFWQPFLHRYTELSPRARDLLRDPFCHGAPRAPRDAALPLLGAAAWDWLRHRPAAIPLARLLQPTDTLLLTSLFPDNRLEFLLRLSSTPARKLAIFHDAIPLRDANVPAWEKGRHRKTLQLLAKLDGVIAVSQTSADELHELWRQFALRPTQVDVLPWPVPFSDVRPAFTPPPWEPKRLLYVSRLKLTKNHLLLFAACEQLWRGGLRFSLDLIGCQDVASETNRILREMARLQQAGHPIQWRGQVTEAELHDAYQQCTFTVFPSFAEGFGLPVLESCWHGRAVVCSETSALGELTQGGGCHVVPELCRDALTRALRDLLTNQETTERLAREAYARPCRTWADYGNELENVLK